MSPPSQRAEPDSALSRRRLLASVATVAATASAGCVTGGTDGRDRKPEELSAADDPGFVRHDSGAEYRLVYGWNAAERDWRIRTPVGKAAYRSARAADRSFLRCFRHALSSAVTADLVDRLVAEMADVEGPLDRLAVATAFVQSRDYRLDAASTGEVEYPKYVIETLVENGGDCEDLTFLLAGVLAGLPAEYRSALVFYADHVGVGVPWSQVDASGAPPGDQLLAAGDREYLYLETTTPVPVGRFPDGYGPADVVAVYDGRWRYVNVAALGDEVDRVLADGQLVDPRTYV